MVTIVAMDISSRRLCQFHMKGLKLINSFQLGGNTSGWAANAATCLFPGWTGGLGVQMHVHGALGVCHTRAAVCVCVHLVCAQAWGKGPDCLHSPEGKGLFHCFPNQPARYWGRRLFLFISATPLALSPLPGRCSATVYWTVLSVHLTHTWSACHGPASVLCAEVITTANKMKNLSLHGKLGSWGRWMIDEEILSWKVI